MLKLLKITTYIIYLEDQTCKNYIETQQGNELKPNVFV